MAEDLSRVQRLKYRAWRRGMRECDLVLGAFADANLATMTSGDLDAFEALMEAPDDQLWTWILGSAEPDPEFAGPMLDRVIAFGREELS
ncbi:MAG: succinate dehydrogenase assembly factor 2 [Caulobacterales bacterium]|nr:succinate dehydrogenase assembly factor 2 [Caulobacterales bacterium]